MSDAALRILGIDPGLNRTGYGVVSYSKNKFSLVASGVIEVPQGELSLRLGHIFNELTKVIEETDPAVAAIEKTFLNTNAQSSMLLSHARGAAMTAVAARNIECREFSTREIKKSVTGYGAATKEQIQEMVRRLLGDEKDFASDEADALATAICYGNSKIVMGLIPGREKYGVSGTATSRKGASASRSRSQWTRKFEGVGL